MGSYTPRHLKHEQNRALKVVGRRGAAIGIGLAVAIPGLAAVEVGSASTASAASAQQVLHLGSTGYYVKAAQRFLRIPQTSRFDARTLNAVRNWQRIKHLQIDGVVGPITWRSMGGYPAAPKPSAPVTSTSGSRVVSIAERYVGVPYRYGGSSPSGFDCSGFTSYVYRQAGHSLPRTAAEQARVVKRVSSPKVGDLVFYGSPAYHVGIYVGGGQLIDSGKPGMRIHVRKIWGSPYYGHV